MTNFYCIWYTLYKKSKSPSHTETASYEIGTYQHSQIHWFAMENSDDKR